jgi:sensor histidine kinase YesM
MMLNEKDRQLIRAVGLINVLLLVLCSILVLSLGLSRAMNNEVLRKLVALFVGNLICWSINIANYIFLAHILWKKGFTGKVIYYGGSYVLSVTAVALLANPLFLLLGLFRIHDTFAPFVWGFGLNSVALLAIELLVSRNERITMRLENAELRMMTLQAQHEKLKNQLHPHFLFNSLNVAKALIRRDPALAESYIIKLSDFLRFSVSHNEHNIVSLKEELKFSLSYLEMQKIRFRGSLIYEVDEQLNTLEDAMVPVFSLQLLLENAIKHNTLTNESPLVIRVCYTEPGWLIVNNNLSRRLNVEEGAGMGLKNLADRYKLLSGEEMRINVDNRSFQVYIKLLSK